MRHGAHLGYLLKEVCAVRSGAGRKAMPTFRSDDLLTCYSQPAATESQLLGRTGVTLEQLERAGRLYRQNSDAAKALGIAMRSFGRLCRQHSVETPYARKCRALQNARAGAA